MYQNPNQYFTQICSFSCWRPCHVQPLERAFCLHLSSSGTTQPFSSKNFKHSNIEMLKHYDIEILRYSDIQIYKDGNIHGIENIHSKPFPELPIHP